MTKNSSAKYIQVKQAILQDIQDGILKTGDRLDNRDQLIKKYGVARATLNKAVDELISSGFLQARRKLGTFVAPPQARGPKALVCPVNVFQMCPDSFTSTSNTSKNIFNAIMAFKPNDLELNIVDSKTLSPALTELQEFGRVLWLLPDFNEIEKIKKSGLTNCCILNRHVTGCHCISTDHYAATFDVTTLFLKQFNGDCQIIYLDSEDYSGAIREERRDGFVAACEQYQIFYKVMAGKARDMFEKLKQLKVMPDKKLVIVSCSRFYTGSVVKLSACKELTFGQDLFYSDFDNFESQIYFGEPMLSVVQDYNYFAKAATEFLTVPELTEFKRIVPHRIIHAARYFS